MINSTINCPIHGCHIDTFFSKVEKSPSCWTWSGLKNCQGYGRITAHHKEWGTHRFSWVIHYGHIPQDTLVCHTCDNPSCVNPAHLFLGTYRDNAIDRNRKGRARDDRGEKHPCAKLSEAQVREIKQKLKDGWYGKDLAEDYGVHATMISQIKLGKKWKHLS